MGVRRLQTFFERERQVRPIKLADEIDKWKKDHPDETPVLVIDFYNLCFCLGSNITALDTVCSGGRQAIFEEWKKLLTALKATGAALVFFVDLNVHEGKVDEWLRRRNREFESHWELYGFIELGLISAILSDASEGCVPGSAVHAMIKISKTFGDVHYSFRHECDLEMAQYAMRENALAIVSSDTDFLIFDGSWRYWSAKDLHIGPLNQLRTIEFNRKGLETVCSLSQYHLPLLATLLTNDFTHEYHDQLLNFYNSLGPMKYVVKNVARYVKKVGSVYLSDLDIRRLTQHAFGRADDKIQRLIRQSLDSYNIDFVPVIVEYPLEKTLLNTAMYEPYIYYMGSIQDIILGLYDMRDCRSETNLPWLLADWAKRKTGIVRHQIKDDSYTFTLLTKKQIKEDYKAHKEEPIYPQFDLPPLDELYIEAKTDAEVETNEIRWKILGFIMSLPNDAILALKNLPKKYLLVCTVLYALVKHELLTVDEADGILYTEYKFDSGEDMKVDYPNIYRTRSVRVAHIYDTSFHRASENFAIAGLLSLIQDVPQFDGVYFQKVMEQTADMNATDRENFIEPINDYRVYAIGN